MSKHNKKRNTAFIYEALVREVVKQSIAKNKQKRKTKSSRCKVAVGHKRMEVSRDK